MVFTQTELRLCQENIIELSKTLEEREEKTPAGKNHERHD